MVEVWKDVVRFEGSYQVSDQGRVRSLGRVIETKQYDQYHKGRVLSMPLGTYGYPTVNIGRKCRRVHQLVAEAFLGKRPDGFDTRHLDGVKTNCRADNLQYCPHSVNQRDIRKHQVNPNAKQVRRSDGKIYLSLNSVEEEDGFYRQNVRQVCRGKRTVCGGYGWSWL